MLSLRRLFTTRSFHAASMAHALDHDNHKTRKTYTPFFPYLKYVNVK